MSTHRHLNIICTAAAASLFTLPGCNLNKEPLRCNDFLVYDRPASIWEETLPLGNGRLGLEPDGNPLRDYIVLNDISMWAGCEADYGNPQAAANLPKIRQLLFEGKNYEAQQLMYRTFVPKSTSGDTYGSYQMLGSLSIVNLIDSNANITNYSRKLDMSQGVAYTSFTIGNTTYHREYFASRDADVIVIRLSTDGDPLNISASITRAANGATSTANNAVALFGELPSGIDGISGVEYLALLGCNVIGDSAKYTSDNREWTIRDAKEVTFIVSAATSYLYPNKYADYAEQRLQNALRADYASLKQQHIAAHSELYNRVSVNIEGNGDSILTTDRRIARFTQTEDPALAALYYNFGRYSLISSTRQGSLPPNLQGLWANECGTPWNGDYHTNINVQMNHWPLEQGNLGELYEPLIALVERSVPSGEKSAKTFYGNDAEGWVMHMMTNVWNFTAPGEHPSWGATNTGGAWLCAHLWEHYEYTLDTDYLRRIYPTIKGAAQFFKSTMVTEPKHGWLVTAPTSSPENEFLLDGYSEPISICMGPTMDTQLVTELFTNVSRAAEILGIDSDFAAELKADIAKLPPMQIAPDGYLMEWLEDYREADVHHRHVSHLYGLHPGNQITPAATPELAQACRVTLNRRGDGGTGWSRAWKINFWARLRDGNRALALFKSLLQPAVDSLTAQHGSGTFPNLWCSHPPFQLDGNFGGAAGIGEMLLQSQNGYIDVLPALPDTWARGNVKGMKVRGGAEVSFAWDNAKLQQLSISGGKAPEYKVALPLGASTATVTIGDNTSSADIIDEGTLRYFTVSTNGGKADIAFKY